ncbi:MAG: MBL fold metallo-hydrolase [Janthinobacterium lividum]
MTEVTFWGTRGSIACANPNYIEFGGHTSCVSLLIEEQLLIFDAGSGLYDLGEWIQKSKPNIKHVDLFLTHFHYDHVMGLPFFAPLWNSDFHITIHHASSNSCENLVKSFVKQRLFSEPFFPVPFEKIPSRIDLKEHILTASFALSPGLLVYTQGLNHPGEATGYRIEYKGKVFSYVTDTEHTPGELDKKILNLISHADLAIYDATFTDEEFKEKKGWGHSTWQQGVWLAQEAGVKKLAFFHHAPSHTDDILNAIEQEAQALLPSSFVARQGTTVIL